MSEFGISGQNASAEFFFRVADRLQMESCVSALVSDGKSVVISSESNELIDHYGAAFVRRIKQKLPQTQFEVFLPRDTEAMLERFNQLLNTLSLDVAIKPRSGAGIDRVWVVHDANAMGPHEIQLLTRLIQQFPGAGTSVVLMFTQGTEQGDAIASQNKQFISWSLELPTAEQKLAAIQQARKSGQEQEAIDFFNRLTKATIKRAPQPGNAAPNNQTPDLGAQKKAPPVRPANQLAKSFAISVIVLGLLAISTGVTFWMNPEVADQLVAKGGGWLRGMTQQSKEDAIAKSIPVENNANKETPPGPPKELEPKVELVADPAPTASPSAATSATPNQTNATVTSSAPITSEKPSNSKVITELPEVAVQGRLWLKGLPLDAYVLEHQNFATVKEARAFMKDKEWLVNARITPVFKEGKDEARFAVMTGPYRTIDRAKNTITRLKLPSDATITSVQMANNQAQADKSKP
jgi:hypothetical protein